MNEVSRTLDEIADDVRNHLSGAVEDIIKAGQALQEGRDMHKSDNAFHEWCKSEFPYMDKNKIYRLRQIAKKLGGRSLMIDHGITALYELAAPSVPDELVEDFLSSDEPIKVKDVKAAKEGYKKVQDEGNEDLFEAVSSGLMKPREAAKEAFSRAEEAKLEFNSLSDEEKIERLGGAKRVDAAYQRKLDETLGEDFNPHNAATAVLISLNRLRIFGGKKEIEKHIMSELDRSARMQKYEAEALILLAQIVSENYDEIASYTETKPKLKLVN